MDQLAYLEARFPTILQVEGAGGYAAESPEAV
jgi:hypothetical protein